jgi:hypothetical protein
VNRTLAAQADKVAKIDDIASQVASAAAASDKAARDITTLQNSTQAAVNQLGTELATLHEKVKHIEEAHVAKAAAKGAKGEPAVAGPGEYIVKSGDTGAKIARANGCTLADLDVGQPRHQLDPPQGRREAEAAREEVTPGSLPLDSRGRARARLDAGPGAAGASATATPSGEPSGTSSWRTRPTG